MYVCSGQMSYNIFLTPLFILCFFPLVLWCYNFALLFWLFRSKFHKFVNFPNLLSPLIYIFIPFVSKSIVFIMVMLSNVLSLVLLYKIWSILEYIWCAVKNNVHYVIECFINISYVQLFYSAVQIFYIFVYFLPSFSIHYWMWSTDISIIV